MPNRVLRASGIGRGATFGSGVGEVDTCRTGACVVATGMLLPASASQRLRSNSVSGRLAAGRAVGVGVGSASAGRSGRLRSKVRGEELAVQLRSLLGAGPRNHERSTAALSSGA